MSRVTQLSGKIYPDSTFAIGAVPPKKKRLDDSLYDKAMEENYDSYKESYFHYGRRKTRTVLFLTKNDDGGRFIKGSQSSRKLERYGNKGITGYGKKCINCFGVLLSKHYRKSCLGFGTCTIPGFSSSILRIIGTGWGEITRRFFQKLRRACEKKGRKFIYFGVSEIQEKRYSTTGIPVPHLHFGYVCRDSRGKEFYFSANEARRYWRESINELIRRSDSTLEGEESEYRASVDIQIIKKSISAYMSKYLTKGIKTAQKIIDDGFEHMLPKQWWFACMQLKKLLKVSTVRISQKECSDFFYGIENFLHNNSVSWCNFVDVETAPGEYRIFGLVGRLSPEFYSKYRDRIDRNKVNEILNRGNN